MKALIISPVAPHPLTEGHRKRIDFTARLLEARGYEITFVLFGWDGKVRDGEHEEIFAHCRARFADFHFVAADDHVGQAPAEDPVHAIDDWWSSDLEVFLAWLSKVETFDLVFVNYVFLSRACELFSSASLRVIDTHDRFAERKELFRKNDMRPEFFYTTNEQEAVGLNRADLVLAIKQSEAEAFATVTTTPVLVMPYYEATEDTVPDRAAGPDRKLRFGYFASSNIINKRNLDYFFEALLKTWPDFGQQCEIAVYGSVCKLMSARDLPEGVVLEGFVDSPRDFYEAVDVVVIPQVFSTGLKIKVAEAMAQGVPLIAHEHAWDGFPVESPLHVCETLEDVALAMRSLVAAPDRLAGLKQATQTAQARLIADVSGAADMLHSVVADIHDVLIVSGPAFLGSLVYAAHVLQYCNHFNYGTKRFRILLLDAVDHPDFRQLKRYGGIEIVPPDAALPDTPQAFRRAFCFADFPQGRVAADSRVVLTSAVAAARVLSGVAPGAEPSDAPPPGPEDQILRLTGNPLVPMVADTADGTLPGAFRWAPYRVPMRHVDFVVVADEISLDFRLRFSQAFPETEYVEWKNPVALREAYATIPTLDVSAVLLLDDASGPELDLFLDFLAVSGGRLLQLPDWQDVPGSFLREYLVRIATRTEGSLRERKPLGVRYLERLILLKSGA